MQISKVQSSITVAFSVDDIIKLDDTRLVVPVPIQMSTRDTYETSDGTVHVLERSHTADPHLTIPIDPADKDQVFDNVANDESFEVLVKNMSISDTRITGSEYILTTV